MEFVVIWVLCGIAGSMIGARKGLGCEGFALGVLLGPIGLLIAALMQGDRRPCPFCRELVRDGAAVCPHCHRDLASLTTATDEHQVEDERLRLEWWQKLDGWAFERELAALLRRLGYDATPTPRTGDGGTDIAVRQDAKRIIVQCKAHRHYISPGMVRELYGTMIHEGADEAWLVTTGRFGKGARRFAHGKAIQLITIRELLAKVRMQSNQRTAAPPALTPPSETVSSPNWVATLAVLATLTAFVLGWMLLRAIRSSHPPMSAVAEAVREQSGTHDEDVGPTRRPPERAGRSAFVGDNASQFSVADWDTPHAFYPDAASDLGLRPEAHVDGTASRTSVVPTRRQLRGASARWPTQRDVVGRAAPRAEPGSVASGAASEDEQSASGGSPPPTERQAYAEQDGERNPRQPPSPPSPMESYLFSLTSDPQTSSIVVRAWQPDEAVPIIYITLDEAPPASKLKPLMRKITEGVQQNLERGNARVIADVRGRVICTAEYVPTVRRVTVQMAP